MKSNHGLGRPKSRSAQISCQHFDIYDVSVKLFKQSTRTATRIIRMENMSIYCQLFFSRVPMDSLIHQFVLPILFRSSPSTITRQNAVQNQTNARKNATKPWQQAWMKSLRSCWNWHWKPKHQRDLPEDWSIAWGKGQECDPFGKRNNAHQCSQTLGAAEWRVSTNGPSSHWCMKVLISAIWTFKELHPTTGLQGPSPSSTARWTAESGETHEWHQLILVAPYQIPFTNQETMQWLLITRSPPQTLDESIKNLLLAWSK